MSRGGSTWRALLLVALGGAIGASMRYLLLLLFTEHLAPAANLPWAILLENILGSFGLGFLAWLAAGRFRLGVEARLLLGVGVLGGFTTFATFAVDVVALADSGRWGLALTYVTLTTVLSIAAALGGLAVARLVSHPVRRA
jgi:CrcB protein